MIGGALLPVKSMAKEGPFRVIRVDFDTFSLCPVKA
jgi:hypothetical protein